MNIIIIVICIPFSFLLFQKNFRIVCFYNSSIFGENLIKKIPILQAKTQNLPPSKNLKNTQIHHKLLQFSIHLLYTQQLQTQLKKNFIKHLPRLNFFIITKVKYEYELIKNLLN